MRSFVKKIASVLAAAFIISTFSMLVSASTLLDSGTVFGGHGSFSWEYYSDKTLKIYPSTNYLYIYESDFPSISLGYETTIYLDVSNLDPNQNWSFLSVYGYDCPCCYFVVGGSTLADARNISFYGFDALESVVFDDEANLDYVSINNCGLAMVNIFDQAEINSLYISDSDYLVNAKVPNYIKDLTIWDCDNLRSIDASEGLKYLFVNNSPLLTEINIPESLYSCYLENVGFTTINVPNTCENFCIYSQDLEEATIEPGRTRINASMFRDCTNLRKVNIPDGVTTIEYSAFAFCFDLPWVTIPDSVEKIYSGAFIGSGIYNMTIPDGVTSIEYATFRSCDNLEWIDLPASITRIDESAFDSCENLTDVCFRGSRKQWDEITVYNGWDDKVSDKTLADIFGDADIWFDDLSIIKTQPVDFYGPYGSTAVFSIESYNEIAEYQWQCYVDGFWRNLKVDSAQTSQLSFEFKDSVSEPMAGVPIRCVLTDVSGFTETSEEVCIVLIDEVNIVKQPEDLTCEPGEMATFSVEAEGEGLKYQWQVYKNGSWTNCSIKDGAKTPVLTLEAKESRNETRYKCIITDKYGYSYESADAYLLVRKSLAIMNQPENCSGAPGETATFTVIAEGSGLKYQWQTYKNGSWTNCSTKDGAKTATLSLEMKDSRHGSKYQCVITDKYGDTVSTNEVTMSVAKPLSIKQHPANATGKEGEMATFKVVAEGSGLKYQWQVFKNGTWTNCSVNDGAKTDTLTIEIKPSRDGLRYQCVVTDRTGTSVTSNEATITARDLFILVNSPVTEITAYRGSYVDFTVEAYGDGLKYQWQVFKNGEWTNCSVNDGAKTDTMTLEAKMSRDGLKYHCVVTDKYGQTQTSNDITFCVIDLVIIRPERSVVSSGATTTEVVDACASSDYDVDTELVEAADAEETLETVEISDVVEVAEIIDTVPEVETETVTEGD